MPAWDRETVSQGREDGHLGAGKQAVLGAEAHRYERHRPEQTLRYRLVEQHYPAFVAALAAEGREVPGYVAREFEEYLRCGRLEWGFLRVRCEVCHRGRLVAFSCKRRGFCPSCGARRRQSRAPPCWSTTSCRRRPSAGGLAG